MKVKVKKDLTLEELFENKGLTWEKTMGFLKMIKYGNDVNKTFETIREGDNNYAILLNGEEYLVNKNVFNVVIEEDKKIEKLNDKCRYYFATIQNGMTKGDRQALDDMFEITFKTIDELIDEVNKLKGEKENE